MLFLFLFFSSFDVGTLFGFLIFGNDLVQLEGIKGLFDALTFSGVNSRFHES